MDDEDNSGNDVLMEYSNRALGLIINKGKALIRSTYWF